jgi:hypothetical protein
LDCAVLLLNEYYEDATLELKRKVSSRAVETSYRRTAFRMWTFLVHRGLTIVSTTTCIARQVVSTMDPMQLWIIGRKLTAAAVIPVVLLILLTTASGFQSHSRRSSRLHEYSLLLLPDFVNRQNGTNSGILIQCLPDEIDPGTIDTPRGCRLRGCLCIDFWCPVTISRKTICLSRVAGVRCPGETMVSASSEKSLFARIKLMETEPQRYPHRILIQFQI